MKRKYRKTSKRLPDLKNMNFQFREINLEKDEFRDYYKHTKAQITLIRYTATFDDRVYVHWECPELGGGNAGLQYWLNIAKQRKSFESKGG